MDTVTKSDYDETVKIDPYQKGRWVYYSKVVEIINKEKPCTVLELGSCGGVAPFPMVKGSDTFDLVASRPNWKKTYENLAYEWDATNTPWPIESQKYDMFVALQVWEHLGNKQEDAFREVLRVSRSAILSFPYLWNVPNDKSHHMISHKRIGIWTLGIKPEAVIMAGNRVIYHFKFA